MSVTSPHADDQPALTPQARELLTIARQEGWAGAERSLQLVDPDTREALIRGGWVRETERGRLLWTEEARGMEVPAEDRAGVRRYRLRPVTFEAMQVTGWNGNEVAAWMTPTGLAIGVQVSAAHGSVWWSDHPDVASYATNNEAEAGDWIVRRDDCFERVEAERFAERYEPA